MRRRESTSTLKKGFHRKNETVCILAGDPVWTEVHARGIQSDFSRGQWKGGPLLPHRIRMTRFCHYVRHDASCVTWRRVVWCRLLGGDPPPPPSHHPPPATPTTEPTESATVRAHRPGGSCVAGGSEEKAVGALFLLVLALFILVVTGLFVWSLLNLFLFF